MGSDTVVKQPYLIPVIEVYSVFRDDEPIGMVTSGAYGHRIQQAIGLAYFRVPLTNADELSVEILGRRSKAKTCVSL